MKGASKALEARLELAGHANFFPSEPVVTTKEWDLLQTYNHRTLLCTVALQGSGGVWRSAVAAITADAEDMQQLIHNLAVVKRTVAPTSHATVLLMPSQGFIKQLLKEQPDIANDELVEMVEAAAAIYARYYVNGNLQDPAPDGDAWSLEAALKCFESFYVLEALQQRWTPVHYFKCNCPECFKCGSCVHSILAGMVCHPEIRVPPNSLGATVQGRRRRGRPSSRGCDIGDVAEERARVRLELSKEYRLPRVSVSRSLVVGLVVIACVCGRKNSLRKLSSRTMIPR